MLVRIFVASAIVSAGLLLEGCGGGHDAPPPALAAPSALTYKIPTSFTVDFTITTVTPTVTGTVSSYSINPALPQGLSFDTTSGAISGVPRAESVPTTYTVTASNAAGSTTTTFSFKVIDQTDPANYQDANVTLTVGEPMAALIPDLKRPVVTWSIDPQLPAGLSFNTSNGTITGTPTAASASAQYFVRSTTGAGVTTTFTLVIKVQTGLLMDVGNVSAIHNVRISGNRVLSRDTSQYWVLWDLTSGKILAHNRSPLCNPDCSAVDRLIGVDLAGTTAVIGYQGGVDLYNATDGTVLARIPASLSWWKLANDGSYLAGGNDSGLYVWNTSGKQLLVKSGDYHKASVVALPGEIRVALGAAGNTMIESIVTATGTSTISPAFQGTFQNWFLDGSRFMTLTSTNGVEYIYSKDAAQLDMFSVSGTPTFQGTGTYFWNGNVIYTVGNGLAPLQTVTGYQPLGATPTHLQLLSTSDSTQLRDLDLSGASIVTADYALPADTYPTTVAGTPGDAWALGTSDGPVLDGSSIATTPRYLGTGPVNGIAGGTGHFALAMGNGKILYFNSSTNAQEGSLNFRSTRLRTSTDGTVLAALGDNDPAHPTRTDSSIHIYSLPTGTLAQNWLAPSADSTGYSDMTLSADGSTLGQVMRTGRRVVPTLGGATIWSDNYVNSTLVAGLSLSPDGTHIAAVSGNPSAQITTKIYLTDTLVGNAPGWAPGWIDNNHLLVNIYDAFTAGVGFNAYDHASFYDATGTLLGKTALTELRSFTPITTDTVYSSVNNSIYSITSGQIVWSSPNPFTIEARPSYQVTGWDGPGAVAGSEVVFVSGTTVRTEAY